MECPVHKSEMILSSATDGDYMWCSLHCFSFVALDNKTNSIIWYRFNLREDCFIFAVADDKKTSIIFNDYHKSPIIFPKYFDIDLNLPIKEQMDKILKRVNSLKVFI